MTSTRKTPSIMLTDRDNDRLTALAAVRYGRPGEDSGALALELERALLVEPANIQPNVVTMNTRLIVREEGTGMTRELTLVYPGEADISIGNLSILTPAGTALIGLSEGETMAWITRDGQTKKVTVVEILYQPEANGRFDQ